MSTKNKSNTKAKAGPKAKIDLDQEIRKELQKTDPRDLPIIHQYVTALANKANGKAKAEAVEKDEFNAEPAFPIKFMQDVAFVAYNTLWAHMKEINTPDEVVSLFDAICGIYENIAWIDEHNGKTSHASNEFLVEFVADCVRYTAKLGGKMEIVTP